MIRCVFWRPGMGSCLPVGAQILREIYSDRTGGGERFSSKLKTVTFQWGRTGLCYCQQIIAFHSNKMFDSNNWCQLFYPNLPRLQSCVLLPHLWLRSISTWLIRDFSPATPYMSCNLIKQLAHTPVGARED